MQSLVNEFCFKDLVCFLDRMYFINEKISSKLNGYLYIFGNFKEYSWSSRSFKNKALHVILKKKPCSSYFLNVSGSA
jgi:hypothetical protein